jgi:hypothetical protein
MKEIRILLIFGILAGSFTTRTSRAQSAPAHAGFPLSPESVEVEHGAPSPATTPPPGDGVTKIVAVPLARPNPVVPADAEDDGKLRRLETLFASYHSDFASYRLWGTLALAASGSVSIPSGFVIHKRSRSLAGSALAGLGAGELVGAFALALGGSGADADFVELSALSRRAQFQRRSAGDTLQVVESEWQRRARRAQQVRQLSGALGVIVGAAATAGGAYLALSDAGTDQTRRYTLAVASFAVGSFGLLGGLRWLCFETPTEASWKAWRASSLPARRTLSLDFGAALRPGGLQLGLHGRF